MNRTIRLTTAQNTWPAHVAEAQQLLDTLDDTIRLDQLSDVDVEIQHSAVPSSTRWVASWVVTLDEILVADGSGRIVARRSG